MKNPNLTPRKVRTALLVVIILIVGGAAFGFTQGVFYLNKLADETNKLAIKAKISEDNITRMRNLEIRYNQVSSIEPVVNQMVSTQSSHQYQNTTINILNSYAQTAGVNIAQIDFSAVKDIKAAPGAKSILTTITLSNPNAYDSFVKFMRLVESGLSQMQILRVDVRKSKNGAINVGPMIIAIYVK